MRPAADRAVEGEETLALNITDAATGGHLVLRVVALVPGLLSFHLWRAAFRPRAVVPDASIPAVGLAFKGVAMNPITIVDLDGRAHITSSLMRESLVDERVLDRTASENELAILPDVLLVCLGGQSIFDRGKQAVLPVVAELAAARAARRRMVIAVGGGTRVRHTMSIALDMGLPTGGVAQLVGAMEEANAVFLNALLAKHGSIVMQREHFWELPLYLESGMLPIVISIPPYHFWEPPPEDGGALPLHGSDFGAFIHAEVLGMRRILFVKDEDGLYDRDPKRHKHARLIRRIGLDELLADLPGELIVDRQLFTSWSVARHVREVQIVNGLRPDELTRALAGDDVGTVITKEVV